MDKLEYIPGDLVMTNGIPIGTKKGIVYQVTESNADKSAKVKDGNTFTELKGSVTLSNIKGKNIHDEGFLFCDCGAWVKDIVPIPLTPKILEKNGWKKEMYHDWRHYMTIERNILYLSEGVGTDGAFSVCVGQDMSYIASISFVHQLQHLLFGLGIDNNMEV